MLKWLLTLFLAMLLSGLLSHGLRRLGIQRLPGDVEFRARDGRRFSLPLASSLLLSALLGTFVFLV